MPESTARKARYVGYTKGTENHGDEALIWIIRDLLSPEIDVVTEPGPTDIALLGGGTLINQSPWLIDAFSDELSRCGRGIVFGTGVGSTIFWGNHFAQWNRLLDKCAHVGVRGPHSLRLLTSNGFRGAQPIGDPYLALHPPMEYRPCTRRIGINVGTTNDSLHGGNEADFLRRVGELAALLRMRGWSIFWVSVWSRDLEVIRQIRQSGGANDEPLYDARSMTLETLSAIARCEVFLGEKLHALAMSAVVGTPFIAWEYHPKVRDFAASIGMEELVLSTKTRSPTEVLANIESLARGHQVVASQLRREVTVRREAIHAFATRVRRWAREGD